MPRSARLDTPGVLHHIMGVTTDLIPSFDGPALCRFPSAEYYGPRESLEQTEAGIPLIRLSVFWPWAVAKFPASIPTCALLTFG